MTTCTHCGNQIEFYKGHWWHGDDFMCPDGEQPHAPQETEREDEAMKLFAVTVLYTKTDGTDCTAVAMVGAPDALEAVQAATDAVAALPHCRKVQGGACEQLADLSREEPNARETSDSANPFANAPPVPRGHTVH